MRGASCGPACLWLVAAMLAMTVALAENIDPGDDQSQFAWSENAGWINTEPSGDGGPGVEVADFELTGWMWGENVGWISLSCKNTASCAAAEYGVRNDGLGTLSGEAWSENAGWVRFNPSFGGVGIDFGTGEFHGEAWCESLGWIRFASSEPPAYGVRTGWNCDPAPAVPTGVPAVLGATSGLDWGPSPGATGFDVVRGDLQLLRATGGSFTSAMEECPGENLTVTFQEMDADPPPGTGDWYLVRPVNCGGTGSYDTAGDGQTGLRDAEVLASGVDCAAP